MSWRPPDMMRGLLAVLLVGAFMIALSWLFRHAIPSANEQLVNFLLGQLSGFAGSAVAYYLSSSKSSADKDLLIRDVANAGHEDPAPSPAPSSPPPDLPRPTFGLDPGD